MNQSSGFELKQDAADISIFRRRQLIKIARRALLNPLLRGGDPKGGVCFLLNRTKCAASIYDLSFIVYHL